MDIFNRPPLTAKQEAVYAIFREGAFHGRRVPLREIASLSGLAGPNGAMVHIRALVKKGYLKRIASMQRKGEYEIVHHEMKIEYMCDGVYVIQTTGPVSVTRERILEEMDRVWNQPKKRGASIIRSPGTPRP